MKKEDMIRRHSEVSEKSLEHLLVSKVREMGLLVIKNCDPMMSGMPDRLVVVPGGKVVWVELKSRGKHLTPLQSSRIKQLYNLRHIVATCDTREDVEIVLEFIRGCKEVE